jgi:5-methylcytosine-specific restriction endonuclease McrA
MHDTLPKPEKRRSFTPKQRNMVATRQEWLCNVCKVDLCGIAFDIDHVQRLDALGKHEPENWQALCKPCHAEKTRVDNREAKKGRRIRGDNKPRVTKAIPSRPFPEMKLRRSEHPKKITSAGFNKTLRRKMNGKVEAR